MPKRTLLNHTHNSNTQDAVTQQEPLLKNVLLLLNTENTVLHSQVDVVQHQLSFTPLKQESTSSFAMTFMEELKDT